jgi:hypothetical protein
MRTSAKADAAGPSKSAATRQIFIPLFRIIGSLMFGQPT